MALFCLATKMQPSEYRNLTWLEYVAFADALQPASKVTDGYPEF